MELLPFVNLELERGILSSILFNGEILEVVADILTPEDFYLPFHQKLFKLMLWLDENEYPIDEYQVKHFLEKKKEMEEGHFIEIVTTPPLQSVEKYAKELKELALKRELIRLGRKIPHLIDSPETPLGEAIEEIERKLFQIATSTHQKEFQSAEEVVTKTLHWIKERVRQGGQIVTGLDTGFVELNRMTSGLGAGDLIIIAARPAMGKTSFALNIASNIAHQGKGVAIFSLEMPAEQLMLRMVSATARLPLQDLRRGNLDDEGWGRLTAVADRLSKLPIFIDDDGNITLSTIKSKLRKLKVQHPELSLAIVDYLQLISGQKRERHLEIAEISRGLKLLARELQIPIIALSQLNRALESRPNKRPILSDLRESGAIEQDADLIMFIYRDSVYREMEERKKEQEAKEKGKEYKPQFVNKDPDDVEIIIGKQRNGPIGTINMLFHKKYTLFTDKLPEVEVIDPTPAVVEGLEPAIEMPRI
jgi:replicative DNA helicase